MGVDEQLVVEHLFERTEEENKTPPDSVRDRMQSVQAQLESLLDIFRQAIEPPALPAVPGKPKFSTFINKKQKEFGSNTRFKIAQILAQAVDEHGKFMTGAELVKLLTPLGIDVKDFASNIRLLPQEFQRIGLQLQQCILRRKDSRGKYDKKVAYRLAWAGSENAAGRGLSGNIEDKDDGGGEEMDTVPCGGIQIKDLEIAVEAPNSEPGLQTAARKIANNIKMVDGRALVCEGSAFGQRVGVKIEIDRRGDEKIYVVKSNVRKFAENFRLSTRIFRELIAEELGVEKNTIRVDVQDF